MLIVPDGQDYEDDSDLEANSRAQGRGNNIETSGGEQDSEIKRREVVVEEELASHDEEREVMEGPADEEEAAHGIVFYDTSYILL